MLSSDELIVRKEDDRFLFNFSMSIQVKEPTQGPTQGKQHAHTHTKTMIKNGRKEVRNRLIESKTAKLNTHDGANDKKIGTNGRNHMKGVRVNLQIGNRGISIDLIER
jgi:hypothetical protein